MSAYDTQKQHICSACIGDKDVVILAGGRGTRLAKVLGDQPKILASIDGRPFIEYLLLWLRGYGAKRVILSLGYMAEKVVDYLKTQSFIDLEIIFAVEAEPLGTAGGLATAAKMLKSDAVLVVNGDTFVDINLCNLVKFHQGRLGEATIVCADVEDAKRFGTVKISAEGKIISFKEKDGQDNSNRTISAGLYLINSSLIDTITELGQGSLEKDIFEKLPSGQLNAFTGDVSFIDIGTPESFVTAPEILRSYVKKMEYILYDNK